MAIDAAEAFLPDIRLQASFPQLLNHPPQLDCLPVHPLRVVCLQALHVWRRLLVDQQ